MNKSKDMHKAGWADWPYFKRLMELCYADPGFIEKFISSPASVIRDAGLILDETVAKEAVEIIFCKSSMEKSNNLYLRIAGEVIANVHTKIHRRFQLNQVVDPKFRSWYYRQRGKIFFESSINRKNAGLVYVPVSFELTEGCSMHCAFCCFKTDKLKDCFPYSEENAALFQKILLKSKEILGNFSGSGICYFATEPFDNPGYELFLQDYFKVYGYYPQTTTAKAAKDPKRAKALIRMLGEEHLKYAALRFSIYSKEQLYQIHQQFSPEELAKVELVLNNPESLNMYSFAGRARELRGKLPDPKLTDQGSSVCTIGFVVNMVKKNILLTAPRRTDETHPMGMKIFDTVTFTDEISYETCMRELIDKWMKIEIPKTEKLELGSFITYKMDGDYVRIQGDNIHRTIKMSKACRRCFLMMSEDRYTMEQAFEKIQPSEMERQTIIEKLQVLFDAGYLEPR